MINRSRVLVATLAVLALGATPAIAGEIFEIPENGFEGRLERDPRAYFGFNLKRGGGELTVKKVFVRTPFRCRAGAAGYEQFPVRGRFKVDDDGDFGDRVRYQLGTTLFRVKVEGTLGQRGRAEGQFGFVARPDLGVRPRGRDRCASGRLKWRAKRGAEVEVPAEPD